MPSDTIVSRRRFAAVLTAGIAGIAGCTDDADREIDGNTTTEPPSSKAAPPATGDERDESEPEAEEEPDVGWRIDDPGSPKWVDDSGWRMDGHDTANSARNRSAEGPSDDPEVRWIFDSNASTPVALDHHPVIVDGTVYTRRAVSAETGAFEDASFELVAIDGETGDVEPIVETDRSLSRPCVTEDAIYVAVDSDSQTAVHAYDRESMTKRWETDGLLYDPFTIRRVGDVVLATDADPSFRFTEDLELDLESGSPELFAIDAETGALRWKARGIGPNMATNFGRPLATTTVAVFERTRVARRLDDGSRAGILPALPGEEPTRLSDALFEETLLSVGRTANAFIVAAYDWQTLEPRWSRSFPDSRAGGRPTVVDGVVAVPRPDDRTVVGLDFTTGETRWRASPEIAPAHDTLSARIVASDDEFYGVLPGGATFALEPETGTVQWELQTDAMALSWSPTYGVALADDLLVVTGSDGKLFAIA